MPTIAQVHKQRQVRPQRRDFLLRVGLVTLGVACLLGVTLFPSSSTKNRENALSPAHLLRNQRMLLEQQVERQVASAKPKNAKVDKSPPPPPPPPESEDEEETQDGDVVDEIEEEIEEEEEEVALGEGDGAADEYEEGEELEPVEDESVEVGPVEEPVEEEPVEEEPVEDAATKKPDKTTKPPKSDKAAKTTKAPKPSPPVEDLPEPEGFTGTEPSEDSEDGDEGYDGSVASFSEDSEYDVMDENTSSEEETGTSGNVTTTSQSQDDSADGASGDETNAVDENSADNSSGEEPSTDEDQEKKEKKKKKKTKKKTKKSIKSKKKPKTPIDILEEQKEEEEEKIEEILEEEAEAAEAADGGDGGGYGDDGGDGGDEYYEDDGSTDLADVPSKKFVILLKNLIPDADGDDKGRVTIVTHPEWAPIGAKHFHDLVEDGFYKGCRFFRVLPDFIAQFGINGDPDIQRIAKQVVLQDDPVEHSNSRGTLTYATSGPNTRTTQIFFNLKEDGNSFLDSQGFAPFAEVVDGIEFLDRINNKYGEKPSQQKIIEQGNEYLASRYPELTYIRRIWEEEDEGAEDLE